MMFIKVYERHFESLGSEEIILNLDSVDYISHVMWNGKEASNVRLKSGHILTLVESVEYLMAILSDLGMYDYPT